MNKRTKIILSGVALLLAGGAANAAVVCVNPNKPACEATIADGVAAASAGDTVRIANGVYFEEGVTIDKSLKLVGTARAILDGGEIPDPAIVVAPIPLIHGTTHGIIVTANDVTIQGITIRNTDSDGIFINGVAPVTGLTVKNVKFLNNDSDCIGDNGMSNDNLAVINSDLQSCGSDGISVTGNGVTVKGNKIKQSDNGGVDISGNSALVEKNVIDITVDGDSIDVSGDDAIIAKNRISNTNDDAIGVDGSNPRIEKNRVDGIYGNGVDINCNVSPCTGAVVARNRLFNTGNGEDSAIDANADFDGMLIEKNRIDLANEEGIELSGVGISTVSKNRISRAGGEEDCIEASGGASIIDRNIISDCYESGIDVSGVGMQVTNNSVRGAGPSGILVDADSITVANNRVTKNAGFGVVVNLGVTGTAINNNLIKNNRDQICDAGTATVIAANTGNGAIWTTGTTFGTAGVTNCPEL